MYELLPYHYQSQEINRLTLAHFIISGLHFLGATDRVRLCLSLFSVSVMFCNKTVKVSNFHQWFLIFNLISFLKVDKDAVAKWVLSFQAFPSNRALLKKGTFIVLLCLRITRTSLRVVRCWFFRRVLRFLWFKELPVSYRWEWGKDKSIIILYPFCFSIFGSACLSVGFTFSLWCRIWLTTTATWQAHTARWLFLRWLGMISRP